MRIAARLLVALILALGLLWLLPLEGVQRAEPFDAARIGPDPQAWLQKAEAGVAGITPGTEKRIVWAGAAGVKTPLALIYLHGFSATSREIHPVPERVAQALGANLFFTRLTGHGLTGAALAEARAGDWLNDLDEALAIGRLIGERTILIGTSTGGTLAAIAAQGAEVPGPLAGIVLISPNFRLALAASRLLDLPLARYWGPWVAGATRSFEPVNAEMARYWTTSYPTVALFGMAALLRHARSLDFSKARVPALVLYATADRVVSAAATERIAARWGGPIRMEKRVMGPKDDWHAHLIAGDIVSPGQTAETAGIITGWAATLP